ncbi:potassium channel family protein [Arcticibacterium luteifluviistationis]|uniref:Potassium transporter TrkA n=1 Tax=Arcticibacterium luteifluviistationis TaxID=1784714 RepID=A0A2Z4GCN4_9BACT|nr:TrkA family potassium uptake protein [Arcticibacterium luteifluviistationis]AWV99059.1 potassium transporter TrkA [Arcticibacterium luteifluviistationis]
MKYIVIGLGNFGSTLSTRLTAIGHEVFGVDNSLEIVEQLKNKVTHTICLDSSKPGALNSLPIQEADQIIVAIGEDVGASILTTALLKQHNAKSIISRAINPLHQTVLESIGIETIFNPEKIAAEQFAKQLELSGVLESFDLSDHCSILEIEVPKRYLGRTADNIDFFSTYGLKLIAVKRYETKKNIIGMMSKFASVNMNLDPEHEFDESDILVMMGNIKDFQKMIGSDL